MDAVRSYDCVHYPAHSNQSIDVHILCYQCDKFLEKAIHLLIPLIIGVRLTQPQPRYFLVDVVRTLFDFTSELTIQPNQRYTQHTIHPSKAIEGICTGIVKFKNIDLVVKKSANNKWAYFATYGQQSLVPDNLGMAIFYKVSDIKEQTEGEFDHLLIFKPTKKSISFYLLGAWEQEKNGIKTNEEFYNYLDQKLDELNKNGKI